MSTENLDPADILSEALESTTLLNLDYADELRKVAFESAIQIILLREGATEAPATTQQPGATLHLSGPSVSPPQTPGEDPGDPLARIAAKAGTDRQRAADIFSADGDDVDIHVPSSRLHPTSAGATRELALLAAGARQAAGLEEWTPVAIARDLAAHYGKLDGPNFAGNLKPLEKHIAFRGSSRKREMRMKVPGWEQWQELVQRLVESDGR